MVMRRALRESESLIRNTADALQNQAFCSCLMADQVLEVNSAFISPADVEQDSELKAAGIALLAVILTALLILGCRYYRRRGGYKLIRSGRNSGQSWRELMRAGQYSESGSGEENKVALNEFSNTQPAIPNAPPVYEKIASGPSPPPYSP